MQRPQKSNIIASLIIASTCTLSAIGTVSAAENQILFLYTDKANGYTGNNIATRAAQYIAVTNQIYRNSGVNMSVRSIGIEKYNPASLVVGSNALDEIRRSNTVLALRNKYRPDFVVLLTLSSTSACGIGYISGATRSVRGTVQGIDVTWGALSSFSNVAVDCGDVTFAHELGHNMGLAHSKRQVKTVSFLADLVGYKDDGKPGIVPYGYGYGVDGVFTTVMAYESAFAYAPHIHQFSNPDKFFNGLRTGIRNEVNAAAALNFVAADVAKYSDCTFVKGGREGSVTECRLPSASGSSR